MVIRKMSNTEMGGVLFEKRLVKLRTEALNRSILHEFVLYETTVTHRTPSTDIARIANHRGQGLEARLRFDIRGDDVSLLHEGRKLIV